MSLFFGDGSPFNGNVVDWPDIPDPEEEHAPKYIYRAVYDAAGNHVKNIPCLLYMRRGDWLYDNESELCTFQDGYTNLGTGFEEADCEDLLWVCYPKRLDGSMEATASSALVFICREGASFLKTIPT